MYVLLLYMFSFFFVGGRDISWSKDVPTTFLPLFVLGADTLGMIGREVLGAPGGYIVRDAQNEDVKIHVVDRGTQTERIMEKAHDVDGAGPSVPCVSASDDVGAEPLFVLEPQNLYLVDDNNLNIGAGECEN